MHTLTLIPWGVRGSFPVAAEDFLGYGGNTSCFSLQLGEELLVFDAGSGLAPLGDWLRQREDIKSVHILLSHAHLDHVMGLLPFLSVFGPEREIHLYGGAALDGLAALTAPPYWPLSLLDSARLHRVRPGETFRLAAGDSGALLSAMEGSHPGGCLWYRLDLGGSSLAYLLDCEPDPAKRPELLRFAQGASLIVWDASFAPGQEKPGWGHSSWVQGAALGREAGAKRVLMAHYAMELDDRTLQGLERDAARTGGACIFAKERTEIEL